MMRKNHLGNVLAVISDAPSGGTQPTVESLTDYYPFGMAMPGRSYNASAYRFGYTGHEKEGDLAEGVYTTQYRLLDTRLGRWMSVDPLFGKYADMGAYNYCAGNPVVCWDPDGRNGELAGVGTKESPYEISANYYYNSNLEKPLIDGLKSAIADFNNGGKARKIKLDGGDKVYVVFKLQATEVIATDEQIQKEYKSLDLVRGVFYKSNIVTTDVNNNTGEEIGGGCSNEISLSYDRVKKFIDKHIHEYQRGDGSTDSYQPSEYSLIKSTWMHEIGHNLGLVHKDDTKLMKNVIDESVQTQLGVPYNRFEYPSLDNNAIKIMIQRSLNSKERPIGHFAW